MALLLLSLGGIAALASADASFKSFDDPLVRNKILPAVSASWAQPPTRCLTPAMNGAALVREFDVYCDQWKDDCYGYMAMSPADKAIIIGYRGTEGFLQFIMESEETAFEDQVFSAGGGTVSKYFYHGFETIWKSGLQETLTATFKTHPDYEVWFVGHSLGGCMAAITAVHVAATGVVPSEQIRLVTMGQPRTGNKDFADALDRLVPYAYRITHSRDLVPHMPPKFVGYYHHSHEIYYPNTMEAGHQGPEFTTCKKQEDDKCSDGHLDLSINDHVMYYGTDVSAWGKANCPANSGEHSRASRL